jgi:hypothetical protein
MSGLTGVALLLKARHFRILGADRPTRQSFSPTGTGLSPPARAAVAQGVWRAILLGVLPIGSGARLTEFSDGCRMFFGLTRARNPNIDIGRTGMVIMSKAFPATAQRDTQTLRPLAFPLFMLLVSALLAR